jgi:hypothetical protein
MSYISRNAVHSALASMKQFHQDLQTLHRNYGLCMLDNTGRRNILMSSAQEEFFAQELSKSYTGVSNNGKTGEPDILIGELDKELECKITTPTPTGGINLQTDYATLAKKGELDYLYVVADREFEKFVVLHYIGLTKDDFAVPSESSRGKAKLTKHIAESKCKVLWGNVRSKNEIELAKLQKKLSECSDRAVKGKQKIMRSIDYWQKQPTNFVYDFEELNRV